MLLTITTTHRPANDLGYLLHKHPERFQSFDLSFGKVHVYYPEVGAERCTACLLLVVDSVGLVRGKNPDQNFLPLRLQRNAGRKTLHLGIVLLHCASVILTEPLHNDYVTNTSAAVVASLRRRILNWCDGTFGVTNRPSGGWTIDGRAGGVDARGRRILRRCP